MWLALNAFFIEETHCGIVYACSIEMFVVAVVVI